MKKRIAAAALAASLAMTLVLPASAAGVVSQEEAAQVVSALNIMVGDEHGQLNLDNRVTRAEFITMAVKASARGDQVGQAATSPYPDVPRTHWAAGYVEAGVSMDLISGYLDGTFRPGNQITLAEGVSIVLKLLGYTGADFSGAYPTAQMSMYQSLDLDGGLSAKAAGDVLSRRDCMYLFYNLLSVNTKSGQPYLNTLGYSLNAAGEVDRVALLGQVMDGPVVADDSWQAQIPFDLSKASISRAGQPAQLGDIQSGDMIYWNEGMRRLWVYTDRITGTVQALAPSAASPSAVTVAGQTYALETSQAAYALSDFGSFRLGDAVTLLLGRTGGVAAVIVPDSAQQTRVGMVTALSKGSYSSSNGSSYTADTVTLCATDGKLYSYQWSTDYLEVGDLVQISAAEGSVSLKRLGENHFSGKVSADGSSAGGYAFAANVEILDTYEGSAIRVYPGRLAGIKLDQSDVRYYELNAQGELVRLILDEVTGDMHQYGVITKVQELVPGMSYPATYTMDLAGQTCVLLSENKGYAVGKGPVQVKGSAAAPDSMKQLTSVSVDRVESNALVCNGTRYPMVDGTLFYELKDGEYYLSNLSRINDGNHTLTAWYDKVPAQGGCVRVVVAK